MTIEITDHGLVRWLERIREFDLEPERRAIAEVIKSAGPNSTVKYRKHLFEIRQGRLVTIIEDKGVPSNRKRKWYFGADK